MNKVAFRFSFDRKHHADVISILESVPKSMRTAFIVEVIRFVSGRLVEIPFLNRNTSTGAEEEKKIPDSPEPEQREGQGKRFPVDLSKLLKGGN